MTRTLTRPDLVSARLPLLSDERRRPATGAGRLTLSSCDETEDEEGSGIPEFNGLSFTGSVENIGPLWDGDLYEEFSFSGFSSSFPVDTETPSTSGLGSSARRRRDRSDEEDAAAKKPRWSNESDSD